MSKKLDKNHKEPVFSTDPSGHRFLNENCCPSPLTPLFCASEPSLHGAMGLLRSASASLSGSPVAKRRLTIADFLILQNRFSHRCPGHYAVQGSRPKPPDADSSAQAVRSVFIHQRRQQVGKLGMIGEIQLYRSSCALVRCLQPFGQKRTHRRFLHKMMNSRLSIRRI